MEQIKKNLLEFYMEILRPTDLFQALGECTENSPWHREASVLVHTDGVVKEYLKTTPSNPFDVDPLGGYTSGFLASAFHDVGKPLAKMEKHSEDRGNYLAFNGHELLSARLAEDFIISNPTMFKEKPLFELNIQAVLWLIENHLYYLVGEKRISWLKNTAEVYGEEAFYNMLRSDCKGRISDNHPDKVSALETWIEDFKTKSFNSEINSSNGQAAIFPIAASASGKSSWATEQSFSNIFSMDTLRLEWYSKDYSEAFKLSCEDSGFNNKVQKAFREFLRDSNGNVYLDNCNLTRKSRNQFLEVCKRMGYLSVGMTFPISLSQLQSQQESRADKTIDFSVSKSQYFRLQQPSYGEFDIVSTL